MEAMTLERAQARANEIEDAICRGKMDVYQVFTQMRQLIPSAHLAQPAQAVDETDWPAYLKDPVNVHSLMLRGVLGVPTIRSMVDIRGEVPNGEDVQLARIAELQEQVETLTRALSGEKAGPVGDGWQPTDDDVRAWMNRNDITELSVYDSRTAIDDARLMHNFDVRTASPTPDKEG